MNAARPLRVLHVGKFYPPYWGGMETHLETLCSELKNCLTVAVVVANDCNRNSEEVLDGVNVVRIAKLFSVKSAPICPAMARRIRQTPADIVHLHLPNPTALIACLMSGRKEHLILTWHSDIVRQKLLSRAVRPLEHKFLKSCDACIATSPNYIESSPLLKQYQGRCRVIPYGIPIERFRSGDASTVSAIRQRYGPHIVLGVGRLIYYKGFEYAIAAMTRVDGRLLIIGDGPLRRRLERYTQALGMRNRVVFLGEVQNHEISSYYHAADVFVLPSVERSEAFGIVQLEAMACGKPVVNTRLDSGVPFVSLDGVTGITVPPSNAEELAAAINKLLRNDELRVKYGQAARKRVQDEFSVELMARRTLDLYHEVAC